MDDKFMIEALKQARKAQLNEDIPVGAVIVKDNKIIARAYNKREKTNDATGHAEIIAIKKACSLLNDWRLNECTLYVTLEPCMMCMGAAIQARMDKVIYATDNINSGINTNEIKSQKIKNNRIVEESATLLRNFFQNKRK